MALLVAASLPSVSCLLPVPWPNLLPAGEVGRRNLGHIPTQFGKLSLLSCVRLYTPLHPTSFNLIDLHSSAIIYTILLYTSLYWYTLICINIHLSAFEYIGIHSSTLLYTPLLCYTHMCNDLHFSALLWISLHCSTLLYNALQYCPTLLCIALYSPSWPSTACQSLVMICFVSSPMEGTKWHLKWHVRCPLQGTKWHLNLADSYKRKADWILNREVPQRCEQICLYWLTMK